MKRKFQVHLFVLVIMLVVPSSLAQAKSPFSLKLQEQPIKHPSPEWQYLMTPIVMNEKETYDTLVPFMSPDHVNRHEIIRVDPDAFEFGYKSMYQTAYQNLDYLYFSQLRKQVNDPMQTLLTFQALQDMKWSENLHLLISISLSEILDIMNSNVVLESGVAWTKRGNPDANVRFVVYQQTLGGLPLSVKLENPSENHYHQNIAGFTTDGNGRLVSGSIRHPWKIIDRSKLSENIKSWEAALDDLQSYFKKSLPENGQFDFLDQDQEVVNVTIGGEIESISPCFVVRNLDNGNYLALPAWSFLIHGWEHYQHVDKLVTSEGYFVLTVNAVTGEVS